MPSSRNLLKNMQQQQQQQQQDHSPTIVNSTNHTIVVFQERGILYNRQVLRPGEAVNITKKQTGGFPATPYHVHAVLGDEKALPTRQQSMRNLARVSVVPAAFVAGTLATAVSAGTLAGPSAALAPLVSGMVVKGVVIDSTALVAGAIMANRTQAITDLLLKKHPERFMCRTGLLLPGKRYLVVTGGLSDGPVKIDKISEKQFISLEISTFKQPIGYEEKERRRSSATESSRSNIIDRRNPIDYVEESDTGYEILSGHDDDGDAKTTTPVIQARVY